MFSNGLHVSTIVHCMRFKTSRHISKGSLRSCSRWDMYQSVNVHSTLECAQLTSVFPAVDQFTGLAFMFIRRIVFVIIV